MGTPEGEEREKGTGEISETMTEHFLQINLSHQTTESQSSENTRTIYMPKNKGKNPPYLGISFSNYKKKSKVVLKSQRKTNRT